MKYLRQWWSNTKTHVLQIEQWWVLIGLMKLHIEQLLFHWDSNSATVLLLYLSSFLTSLVTPSNLSSSKYSVFPFFTIVYKPFLFSLYFTSFLFNSTFYMLIKRYDNIYVFTLRWVGPPGLMRVAQIWLNMILYNSDTPIAIHMSPKQVPSLLLMTWRTTAKYEYTCNAVMA